MSYLIKKYQNPNSTLDWWNQYESKKIGDKILYLFEDPTTRKWVDPTDSRNFQGVRGYAYYDDEGNPTGRYTKVEGDPQNAPIYQKDSQVQHLIDRYNADKIAEARTGGLEDLVLPWNYPGYIFNNTVGRAFGLLPESAQKVLKYGKYITPSWLIGGDDLFGTSTGTTLDLISIPGITKGIKEYTPYAAASQNVNPFLRDWGRARIVSKLINEGTDAVYGTKRPRVPMVSQTEENPYAAIYEQYHQSAPAQQHSYVRPQIETVEVGAKDPFMAKVDHTKPMPGIVERANAYFPKFNFRKANIQDQSRYIVEDSQSFSTHPILVKYIEGNPQVQRSVEGYASGEKNIPIYTYPNGRQTPLIESTTGENISLGTVLAGEESGIQTPHLQTLVGINPIEGIGGEIGRGGITDFTTRNGFNFSTNNRWNGTQYAWFGRPSEVAQRLKQYGIGENSPLYQYYMNIHKIIDDLNKHYGVKNYFYKNPNVTPMYRGTGKPVNFSLQTHLVKQPNGKIVEWNPVDQAIYQQASDILSQFWGDQLYGGGIKELLIPKQRGFKIGSKSFKPLDYKDLAGYQYIIDPTHKGKLPLYVKNMDALEEWARDNLFKSFSVENINDPIPSNSYADTKFIFGKKNGGKLIKNKNY